MEENKKIPKIIHYCWFGGNEKGAKEQKCIDSWKKFCPDYEIKEWNEENFNINLFPYLKEAYENKKYAFVSDVARLYLVYTYGGFYFDTDVEIVSSLEKLRNDDAFLGFENDNFVANGLGFGAVKGNEIIKENLEVYRNADFKNADGTLNLKGCPVYTTEILEKHGLVKNGKEQFVSGVHIYPSDYFNPYEDATGKLNKTKNTVSIHWYSKSWLGKKKVMRTKFTRIAHRILGVDFFTKFKK